MFNEILNKYADNESGRILHGYNLSSIKRLLKLLDNPQENFPSVHIAGTNGKGTTSMILAQISSFSGYKTGLFTSPHLLKINERIKVDFNNISDTDLNKYAEIIDSVVRNNKNVNPTYFDFLTALAFLYFRDSCIDLAVIETGLGGRLDSTNVIIPKVSVITNISIDHTAILGDTIEQITLEKCGIIKNSVPVVTANRSEIVFKIISKVADSQDSHLIKIDDDFRSTNEFVLDNKIYFDYSFPQRNIFLELLYMPIQPHHQSVNASLAITTAFLLRDCNFDKINKFKVREILSKVSLPGRFEKIYAEPLIIFDPAHNIDALSSLLIMLNNNFPGRKIKIIISMMSDKVNEEIKNFFMKYRDIIIYYQLNDKRAYSDFNDLFYKVCYDNISVADYIINSEKTDIFLFTGTFRIYETACNIASIIGDHSK